MKKVLYSITVILAALYGGCKCFGQIAKDSKPDIFQFSAAGGFPSRETQVKGALHHYTFSVATQYNDKNLYGYYGLGGYYPSLGLSAGIYHYDRASFPGGTRYSNHYSLSVHMGAFVSYNVTEHLKISIGPSYAHHSNSKTHYVNTGCDAISAELALTYCSEPVRKYNEKATVESLEVRKRYWDVQYGACVTGGGENAFNMWTYVSHKASVAHLWRTCRRAAFGIGADAFFDKGGNENRNAFGIGGAVDYFLTRNLLMSGRIGAYLNGSKWYIPYIGFSTKANAGTAEQLEIVVGFRFG